MGIRRSHGVESGSRIGSSRRRIGALVVRKMSGLRRSQSVLHTWSGLLLGWILFGVFLAGTVSFWRDEISRWTRPELAPTIDRPAVLEGAAAFLKNKAITRHRHYGGRAFTGRSGLRMNFSLQSISLRRPGFSPARTTASMMGARPA